MFLLLFKLWMFYLSFLVCTVTEFEIGFVCFSSFDRVFLCHSFVIKNLFFFSFNIPL